MPVFIAARVSVAALWAPSFFMARVLWLSTVCQLRPRMAAACLTLQPSETRQTAREAVAGVRAEYEGLVEVEIDSLEDVVPAARAGADVILLDNMSADTVREAVEALRSEVNVEGKLPELEVSGGVRLSTVRAYAEAGVDRISIGALTHSIESLDVGLDFHPRKGRASC